jgi:deazaflavin-dependent oxidoreductase (nitroreductase family)
MMMSTQYQQYEKGIMRYPANGWRRVMFKAPLILWRLGLGPIIGKIMLIITHTGRKSGLPRHTMVEYHMLDGVKYVPCAFGPRADWFKNIKADPRVTIQTAHGPERAIAIRVTEEQELLAVFDLFMRRDPPLTNWYLDSLGIQPNHDDVIAKKERINWFRFNPTDEPTPPPLEADLVWVLPLLGFGLALVWMITRRVGKSR